LDRALLTEQATERSSHGRFLDQLRRGVSEGRVQVIAELKRRSPSRGALNPSLDAVDGASAYEAGGACALSVLTEPAEFGGSIDDLARVSDMVSIPLLKKDFHVSEIQLLEGLAAGASAALLIARALHPDTLLHLVHRALALGIEPLVEVRSSAELALAVDAGARVIGVNARDLETLAIDPAVVDELLPRIPKGCIAVAESGISDRDDVARVAAAGADAVLVGSALTLAPDPRRAVQALAEVAHVGRG
jgi:indole-3-glycerol phosphate synthase